MPAELTLLVNFAVILIAAEVGSLVFMALRLPRVVGMLAGGILVGPGFNPWAGALDLNAENVRDIAFLGSIFLMFSIGLTFDPRLIRGVARRALTMALFAGFASFALGFSIARAFQLDENTALFVGLLLAPTSSTIGLRLAEDMNLLGMRGIETTMAAIVFDDVIALVFATAVLAVVVPGQAAGPLHAGLSLVLVIVLVFLIILVGVQAIPRALDFVGRFGAGKPTLVIVSMALFVAYLFTLLDLPPIFGAFWAGSMTAASRYGAEMKAFVKPINELFSAVFFAAIGLLMAPRTFAEVGVLAVLLILAGVAAKLIGAYLPLRASRVPVYPALMCATLFVPRGELTLVIAQYATVGVDAERLHALGVLFMLVTALVTPLLATVIRASFAARARAAGPEGTS